MTKTLFDEIKKAKRITLSFKISPEQIQELDKGKSVDVNIKKGKYTIKKSKR